MRLAASMANDGVAPAHSWASVWRLCAYMRFTRKCLFGSGLCLSAECYKVVSSLGGKTMTKLKALEYWLATFHALTRQRHNPHPNSTVQAAIVNSLAIAEAGAWARYMATPSDLERHGASQ